VHDSPAGAVFDSLIRSTIPAALYGVAAMPGPRSGNSGRRSQQSHVEDARFSREVGATTLSGDPKQALAGLAQRLGLTKKALPLLRQAVTHRSVGEMDGESGPAGEWANNERLEFLGDSVLGLLVSEHLFKTHPGASEGEMTRMRARLVSKPTLAVAASRLGLGGVLQMAAAEEAAGGRERPGALSDVFEATLAAVYLSTGLEAARGLVQEVILGHVDLSEAWDHKSRFQEFMQKMRRVTPTYRIQEETGPAHDRTFIAEAMVKDVVYGRGEGRSKKEAEQKAAEAGLAGVDAAGRRRPPKPA